MNCLVTGGAGFIGSNLVDALIARGDRVTVIDSLATGRRENLADALERGVTLHVADIREHSAVTAAFEAARPECVFHLAAHVNVTASVQRPLDDATTNVLGTINVLEAARAAGARRLVNTSSCAIYGDTERLPTPEDCPGRPLAPYGQGKLAAEGYCEVYRQTHHLSSVSLRYSNVYGPRQDAHGEAGVVAIFCARAEEGLPLAVYGDGRQTRDWVEVSDVVSANLLAADSDLTGAINVSRGLETSVLELIAALAEVGYGASPEFAPGRPGEVRRSCLDNSRARHELGWEPVVGLEEGLQKILGERRG